MRRIPKGLQRLVTSDGIATKVRKMEPRMYTIKEAAILVGKSPDTLARWDKDGIYKPSQYLPVGKNLPDRGGQMQVRLYSDDDIAAMKKLAKTLRPGRKPSAAAS